MNGFDKPQSINTTKSFGTLIVASMNGSNTLDDANWQKVCITDGLLYMLGLDGGKCVQWIELYPLRRPK